MITFLIGGARSGKSALAVEIGVRHGDDVVFLATAEAFDDELRARVRAHRAERPTAWTTVEEPLDLDRAVRDASVGSLLIVDCLTVWMGNLFHHEPQRHQRVRAVESLVSTLAARRGPTVIVSNEVGMGIVPEHESARDYRDELGRLNRAVASVADRTLLLVAGRALPLRDPWTLLDGHR